MEDIDNLLITPPDSPYKILSADYDDDARAIQTAFRRFFSKNPKKGIKIGRNAQQKLTNSKERVKTDALCYRVPMPRISLTPLKSHLDVCETDIEMLSNAMNHLTLLSDLFFPEQLTCDFSVALDFGDIEYRSMNGSGK